MRSRTEDRERHAGIQLLELRELDVRADKALLVRGLSVAVAAATFNAVVGPSGSGKTTLLRAIAGLIDPAGGKVLLQGRAPGEWGWPEYRRRVALMQQRPILFPGPVREALRRPFLYRTATHGYDESAAADLLGRAGLPPEILGQETGSLSEGQQQRISFVRTLLIRPRVLLLDEPTSALDADAAAQVEEMLRQSVHSDRTAVILVSHDPAQVTRLAAAVIDISEPTPEMTGEPACRK